MYRSGEPVHFLAQTAGTPAQRYSRRKSPYHSDPARQRLVKENGRSAFTPNRLTGCRVARLP